MGSDEKRFMAQMAHHLDLILRHRSKGVIHMSRIALWLA
jgi:hypothetical protein